MRLGHKHPRIKTGLQKAHRLMGDAPSFIPLGELFAVEKQQKVICPLQKAKTSALGNGIACAFKGFSGNVTKQQINRSTWNTVRADAEMQVTGIPVRGPFSFGNVAA